MLRADNSPSAPSPSPTPISHRIALCRCLSAPAGRCLRPCAWSTAAAAEVLSQQTPVLALLNKYLHVVIGFG